MIAYQNIFNIMKKISLFTFLFLSLSLYSQLKIGVKAGYSLGNLPDPTSNIYSEDYKTLGGIDVGISGEYELSDRFSLLTEVQWVKRGGKRNGLQPIPANFLLPQLQSIGIDANTLNQIIVFSGGVPLSNEDPLYASFENESRINYIEVPVLLKYHFSKSKSWNFYLEGGPYSGFLINAKQRGSGTSQFFIDAQGNQPLIIQNPFGTPPVIELPAQSFDESNEVSDQFNNFNFGLQGGIGVQKRIDDKYEVLFGTRASYGFLSVQEDSLLGSSKIGALTFFGRITYRL